jgi:hypothetical protein
VPSNRNPPPNPAFSGKVGTGFPVKKCARY